eukprot:CAMPEP_0176140314 /NCGR_PEP_ID=MMETSP0120_2-20121206/71321_1 /TAXON_ID=160619 /ORGANISM="Kryptoperidinium foliaceum, Strain CCMP 1326" /LENGTH=89 /DNA_ID=CAMNT_0017476375 /DNA_START=144 /DNA_END=413 /DNA_ORIENTATION=+
MLARAFLAANFFPQADSDHFFMISPFSRACFSIFSRQPLPMEHLKSVKLKRLTGIMWRGTPVTLGGPSTTTRFWSTMSTIVHILPSQGP